MCDANVCRIVGKQTTDGLIEVLGTGCFVRSDDQELSLRIATSKNIFWNVEPSVQIFASFTNVSGETSKPTIEVGPLKQDKGSVNSEVVYFPVEKSQFASRKANVYFDGIPGSNQCQDSYVDNCQLRVLIRTQEQEALANEDEIVTRSISIKHPSVCSFPHEGMKQKLDHLAIEGSPILSLNRDQIAYEFWGLIYSFDKISEDDVLLNFSRHMSDAAEGSVHMQETQQYTKLGNGKPKLSSDDQLEKLWEDQYFQDDISKPLDMEYSSLGEKIKNWNHLAQEFEIPRDVRDRIKLGPSSPTERLFEYLCTTRPSFTVEELCTTFEKANAHQLSRQLPHYIGPQDGKLKKTDSLSVLINKFPEVMNMIILKLDSRDRWKQVATVLEISQDTCAFFQRDPSFNLTRQFFDILRTQSPDLRTYQLIGYLEKLEQNEILTHIEKILGKNHLLKDLSSEIIMCDVIEPKLNSTENNLLFKLAKMFQADGYLRKVDINDFRTSECKESPTHEVIDYVIASLQVEYKIIDLVERLIKIDRLDCVDTVKRYLKDPETVEKMAPRLEKQLEQLKLAEGKAFKHAAVAREISTLDDK